MSDEQAEDMAIEAERRLLAQVEKDFQTAEDLFNRGRYQEAVGWYKQIAQECPDNAFKMFAAGSAVAITFDKLEVPLPRTKEYQELFNYAQMAVECYDRAKPDTQQRIGDQIDLLRTVVERGKEGRVFQDTVTEMDGSKAKRRIRNSYIFAAVMFVLYLIMVSVGGPQGQSVTGNGGFFGGVLFVLMGTYAWWSLFWGVPAVWGWTRQITGKIGFTVVFNPIAWIRIIAGVFFFFTCVGVAYSAFGGGIYHYIKALQAAKNAPV